MTSTTILGTLPPPTDTDSGFVSPSTTLVEFTRDDAVTETIIVTQPNEPDTSTISSVVPSPTQSAVPETSPASKVNATTVGAGVAGALGFVILIMIGIFCIRRKRMCALPCVRHLQRPREKLHDASGSGGHSMNAPTNGEAVMISRGEGIPPSSGVDVARHEGTGLDNDRGNSGRLTEAGINARVERPGIKQRLLPPQQPIDEPSGPSPEVTSPSSGAELETPGLSVEEMSSIVQEMESMRERMAQILRRQQQAVARNSNLATLAPSEAGDSHYTEPPTYSETWQR